MNLKEKEKRGKQHQYNCRLVIVINFYSYKPRKIILNISKLVVKRIRDYYL